MTKTDNTTTIRYKLEQREIDNLSEYATKSRFTKGRKKKIEPCPLRTEFQRDRDRILHSKAFRRLKHKTQVFLSPFDDHFRTRLTHTLEVSQIGRTIARALDFNEDLVEAISLGHDLGHTPFGHCGEGVLNELVKGGFHHNIQSVRVVEVLEDLNLCKETIDGILTHTWGYTPKTPEAQIVQLADKIAYINHDIEDSIRAGIIAESDLPKDCIDYFTSNQSKRLSKMIDEIVYNSMGKPEVSMSEEGWHYTTKLRQWMFENVYEDASPAKLEEKKARNVIRELFYLYCEMLKPVCEETKIERIYISNKETIRVYGNCLYYIDDNTHTLKEATVINGITKIIDIAKKQTDFRYVATTNSKYAIISKHQNGIEIDIDGNCTVIHSQRPLIMKYDEISNMWIWVSKVSNSKYNTIVFRKGKPVIQTTDINYDSMNLQGSVFHRATLCLASNGKMISVMPYVVNMPISKVIAESMISIIRKDSKLYLKRISENRSELYVINPDRKVYKFIM